jgi:hypothetical protein
VAKWQSGEMAEFYKKVSQNGTQFKNYLYLCPQEIKTDIEYGSSNR